MAEHAIPHHQSSPEARIASINRRLFLKGAVGTMGLVMTSGLAGLEREQQHDTVQPADEHTDPPLGLEQTAVHNPAMSPLRACDRRLQRDKSYLDTAMDTLAFKACQEIVVRSVDHTNGTNAGDLNAQFKHQPVLTIVTATITRPLIEEATYRVAPYFLSPEAGALKPLTGLLTSYLFGKAHQMRERLSGEETRNSLGNLVIDRDIIPLTHYATGWFLWLLTVRRGGSHAVAAHMLANGAEMTRFAVHRTKNKQQS